MNSQCVVSTLKHGGGVIMVWGCFGNGQTGDLKNVEGILRKEGYHEVLVKHAIPSGKRLMAAKFTFQQDNDPKLTSILCKKYLENKVKDGTLIYMDHSPQSPDLNPIELLWDELDRRVRILQPRNLNQLWEYLQTAWTNIVVDTLLNLTDIMPRVCRAVINARGGYLEESRV